MKRLVCIVEGQGEVEAIPNLCTRILQQYLHAMDWFVDAQPIRHPRGRLVAEAGKDSRRSYHAEGLRNALMLARQRRRADAVLVLCDADDDCPAAWGPDASRLVNTLLPGGAVMALREYETWLLLNFTDEELARAGVPNPERKRGAKESLARLIPGYLPSTHQLVATRRLDIATVRRRSDSFDKLVRVLAKLSETRPPAR